MNKSKGFTIIELIVVIAIIAVLAAIVLVNVTQYISKSKDAAAIGDMDGILTNSAVYFDANSTYTGINTATSTAAYTTALGATGMNYTVTWGAPTSSAFCASIALKATGNPIYCVDSTGNKKQGGSACSAAVCQ